MPLELSILLQDFDFGTSSESGEYDDGQSVLGSLEAIDEPERKELEEAAKNPISVQNFLDNQPEFDDEIEGAVVLPPHLRYSQ